MNERIVRAKRADKIATIIFTIIAALFSILLLVAFWELHQKCSNLR